MIKEVSFLGRNPCNLHGKIEKNCSTYFLKPIISGDNTSMTILNTADFIQYGLINFYIGWKDSGFYRHQNCMYILMNPSKSKLKEWFIFYNRYRSHRNYVDTIFLDYCVVLLVFRIESKYRGFPKLLLSGKYSYFGMEYADKFFTKREIIYGKVNLIQKEQFFVITKDPNYKKALEDKIGVILSEDAELWSVPDIENEVLNWSKIKQLC